MISQISQVQAPDPSLLADDSNQTRPDGTFAKYLEEEQKRLAAIFAGWGQTNFDGWFSYVDVTATPGQNNNSSAQPEELKQFAQENTGTTARTAAKTGPTKAAAVQIDFSNLATAPRKFLLELLQKNGWLTPNLEAQPLFSRARLSGKLLTSLDLQSLVDEIVNRVSLIREKGKTEFSFGLKSGDLGDILITLASRGDGLSVNIQASAETKKLLDEQLRQLTLSLKKAKINVTEIIVTEIKEENHA